MDDLTQRKDSWGTRVGVILAVTGSAVGLGNFLRFPGLAAQYEGGAFMIPYFVAFLLLGLPLAWAEWALGRYGGRKGFNSTPGVYYAVTQSKPAAFVGVLGLIVPVMIYMFYVFIEAWCLGFAWRYLRGDKVLLGEQVEIGDKLVDVPVDPTALAAAESAGEPIRTTGNFVLEFVGITGDGTIFANFFDSALIFLLLCFVLNFVLIYRGINKGIEWFCRLAMPALVICAIIVLARVLTLPANPANPEQNVINGLGYMWNPGTEEKGLVTSLMNSEMWLAAAGQIFFSLSVGFGIIITYASYMKQDDDVALSGVTAAAGNGWCEVTLGGLILIPAAFVFLGPLGPETLDSAFQLGFIVLPQVFSEMPAGRWFGFLFFFLLFLAAVTSSLSMLQPAIAFLEEGFGIGRKASVSLLGLITAIGAGFVTFFTAGLAALDALDFWVATMCIFILATIQVIVFAWILGVNKGFDELDRGAEIRVPRVVKFVLKYISPVFLLVIFAVWVVQKLPERVAGIQMVEGLALAFIALILITFLLLIAQAVQRWERLARHHDAACPACGSDLRGIAAINCPECGRVLTPHALAPREEKST